jgi:hypothetical protein
MLAGTAAGLRGHGSIAEVRDFLESYRAASKAA